MFGYAHGELEGRPVSILNAPGTEAPEEVAGQIIADLRNQGVWRGEVENVRKDGSRFWCAANVTAFEHGNWGTVWVTIQLDISARKRAEADLQRASHGSTSFWRQPGTALGTGTFRPVTSTSAASGSPRSVTPVNRSHRA